jgi:hypothetical protein
LRGPEKRAGSSDNGEPRSPDARVRKLASWRCRGHRTPDLFLDRRSKNSRSALWRLKWLIRGQSAEHRVSQVIRRSSGP